MYIALLWCVWVLRALGLRAWALLREGPRWRRVLARTALAGTLAFGWMAWDCVALWWARAAWLHAARTASRYPKGRDEAQLREVLRHEALELGLLDLADQPDAIRVERQLRADGEYVRAVLDLRQHLTLLGHWRPVLPIRGEVEERALEVQLRPFQEQENLGH